MNFQKRLMSRPKMCVRNQSSATGNLFFLLTSFVR